ncbi:TetR family transcriptional regulator [Salinisphaera sp.]|uniref:TetR family transcriptional regulator n=1 Tax=Salinisphaera sp. TaxID=1914330 RepID=UPI000C561547|nr:TetR family transcriptional regulator [Salinisphaera sp.]MAS09563.1 TetR family transcriptional regulator [Salinisphaera sp.]
MRRTPEQAEQTRLKVIDAGLRLFSQSGYSGTTLAMIAKEAGMSRGPIYWHFQNKDELFEAVIAYSQTPLQRLVTAASANTPDPVARMSAFIEGWFDLLVRDKRHRQSFEILMNKTELTQRMARTVRRERQLTRSIIELFETLVDDARAQGLLPEGDPADLLALQTYTYLMGVTQTWLFSPRLFSLRERKDYFHRKCLATLFDSAATAAKPEKTASG